MSSNNQVWECLKGLNFNKVNNKNLRQFWKEHVAAIHEIDDEHQLEELSKEVENTFFEKSLNEHEQFLYILKKMDEELLTS